MNAAEIWQLAAGLALFLYGMHVMEDALRDMAGRSFKLFLRRYTHHPVQAIVSGTVVTAVLQSSSVVILMVLALTGAGVIPMRHALGVVFGSNLGSTVSNWVVATAGFKFNIERFALPVIAVAGISMVILRHRERFYHFARFLVGFGILFLGLSYTKNSTEVLLKSIDFAPFLHYNRLVFILMGFLITTVIQSSSATMVITLSALHVQMFPFETAAAIIIGSELGTSMKIWLGAIGGIAEKKRLALGNMSYNLGTVVIATAAMNPLIYFIGNVIGIEDPLIGLVAFQSLINVVALMVFFPFINPMADFLEKRFSKTGKATHFISKGSTDLPEISLAMLRKETGLFLHQVLLLNCDSLNLDKHTLPTPPEWEEILKREDHIQDYEVRYLHVKKSEGEIIAYCMQMASSGLEPDETLTMNRMISAVRNGMYAAKGMKDIYQERNEFLNSSNNVKYEQYLLFQQQMKALYVRLNNISSNPDAKLCFEELVRALEQVRHEYDSTITALHHHGMQSNLREVDLSTLLNVNRERYSSAKALILAFRDYLLDPESAEQFDSLPVKLT